MENMRYQAAIKRNLFEVTHALLELRVLTIFEKYTSQNYVYVSGQSFFNISERALFNDMIAHAIKIFDINKRGDSYTFWDVLKNIKVPTSCIKYEIDFFKKISEKLKHIRDKTHFHIDRKAVLDSGKVWKEANIKGSELEKALKSAFKILNEEHDTVLKERFLFHYDDYTGEDFGKLLELAALNKIINVVPKNK